MKNWTGNKKSIFTTLGASSHSAHEREKNDYYATDPRVIKELFTVENFTDTIWECACGEGHLAKEMEYFGKDVFATDLINRGYGEHFDFMKENIVWNGDIITNPPYKYAKEFAEKSIQTIKRSEIEGLKVALFLKLTFLEGQKRYKFFQKYPPVRIWVYSSRRKCALNGDFGKTGSSASCYAWFVWDKDINRDPIIRWLI